MDGVFIDCEPGIFCGLMVIFSLREPLEPSSAAVPPCRVGVVAKQEISRCAQLARWRYDGAVVGSIPTAVNSVFLEKTSYLFSSNLIVAELRN